VKIKIPEYKDIPGPNRKSISTMEHIEEPFVPEIPGFEFEMKIVGTKEVVTRWVRYEWVVDYINSINKYEDKI